MLVFASFLDITLLQLSCEIGIEKSRSRGRLAPQNFMLLVGDVSFTLVDSEGKKKSKKRRRKEWTNVGKEGMLKECKQDLDGYRGFG